MKTREEYLNDIKQFKKEFANKFGILSIGIFGSVARNEHQAESDLDVFVELQEPDFFIMSDIQETLEQICNCKVDLLRIRKNLRPLLLKRIEQDGIYA
ncbi:MAG: nucleotidyltransferase domain-containing protein [Bacteroides sp.]|nr:nucleotidyltransferase domain-containing protein [Bacteroides sp.]